MKIFAQSSAMIMILACFFNPIAAQAQNGSSESNMESGSDNKRVVGPSFDVSESAAAVDFSGLQTAYQRFDESHQVEAETTVSISSEFGRVRVDTWDSQVVRVKAEVTIGAESKELAEKICNDFKFNINMQEGEILEVETVFPEAQEVPLQINYQLTIPQNVRLVVDNFFGDTEIQGLGSPLTLRARYGSVLLSDINAPVNVRVVGDFPLLATGLSKGGRFILRGAKAEFSDIAGDLTIGNYLGSVNLRNIDEHGDVEVYSECGPTTIILDEDANPNIEASAHFGSIETNLPLEIMTKGNVARAYTLGRESDQIFNIQSFFEKIIIDRKGSGERTDIKEYESIQIIVKQEQTETRVVKEDIEINVDAIIGDVTVEGVDEDKVTVIAKRFVRMKPDASAKKAIEALDLNIEEEGDTLRIDTNKHDDMAKLGCTSYRIDLLIKCPRTVSATIYTDNSTTSVSGIGGSVVIIQDSGSIAVNHVKGELELRNNSGNIDVSDCAGPVEVSTKYGDIEISNIYGRVEAYCENGRVTLEALYDEVVVKNSRGDVRILAFDEIGGDYNVEINRGDLDIVLPKELDASLFITAEHGTVRSVIPLTGTIEEDVLKFQARVKKGKYTLNLKTIRGNIQVD